MAALSAKLAALEKGLASEVAARSIADKSVTDIVSIQNDIAAQLKEEVAARESDGQKKLSKLQTEIEARISADNDINDRITDLDVKFTEDIYELATTIANLPDGGNGGG